MNDFIYTPVTEREKLVLNNHNITALVLDLPLHCQQPAECAMNVHHQLWRKANSQDARVVQRWLRLWGWLPPFMSDACFMRFTWRRTA